MIVRAQFKSIAHCWWLLLKCLQNCPVCLFYKGCSSVTAPGIHWGAQMSRKQLLVCWLHIRCTSHGWSGHVWVRLPTLYQVMIRVEDFIPQRNKYFISFVSVEIINLHWSYSISFHILNMFSFSECSRLTSQAGASISESSQLLSLCTMKDQGLSCSTQILLLLHLQIMKKGKNLFRTISKAERFCCRR